MNQPIDPWPLLQKRFPSTEYALLTEVRDKAGFAASRSADGIAMNLWPSRGLHINGIEVKSYRSDWLGELKKPFKAEAIYQFCDYWWIVAAAEGIVKPEEVPKTWGFLEVQKGRLKTIIEAPKLTPIALDRHFVAAMLKRATKDMVSLASISDQLELARKNGVEIGERKNKHSAEELQELRKMVQEFEEASGISINRWSNPKKIGAAVKFIENGGTESIKKELEQLQVKAQAICGRIEGVLSSITDIQPALTNENNQP